MSGASSRQDARRLPGQLLRHPRLRALALVVAVGILVPATMDLWVARVFVVPSVSMQPTLRPGDRILVQLIGARGRQPRRGAVVVLDGAAAFGAVPTSGTPAGAEAGAEAGADIVKRVVAVGGDRLRCCAPDGRLVRNGHELAEPYLAPGVAASDVRFDVEVPRGYLWVMGDNRPRSQDSRAYLGLPGGGLVPNDAVLGPVIAVVWPPSRWSAALDADVSAMPAPRRPRDVVPFPGERGADRGE